MKVVKRTWLWLALALIAVLGWNAYLRRRNASRAAELWDVATDDVDA
jgi:hypothetical protein